MLQQIVVRHIFFISMCTERLKAEIPLLSFVLNCSAQYFPVLQYMYMVLYRETPKSGYRFIELCQYIVYFNCIRKFTNWNISVVFRTKTTLNQIKWKRILQYPKNIVLIRFVWFKMVQLFQFSWSVLITLATTTHTISACFQP